MTVAELLRQSMSYHRAYQQFARQRDKAKAREALKQASDLRIYALSQDPGRTDPAWTDEQKATNKQTDTHDALMKFYSEQLGI